MQELPPFVGFRGLPTRSWRVWGGLILVSGFLFWIADQFVPIENSVPYSPWFLNQVEADNIASVTLSLKEPWVRGVLRQPRQYRPEGGTSGIEVRRFVSDLPSEEAVRSLAQSLEEGIGPEGEAVQISWSSGPSRDSPRAQLTLWASWVLVALVFGYGSGYVRGYRHGRSGRFSQDVKVVKDAAPSAEPPTP